MKLIRKPLIVAILAAAAVILYLNSLKDPGFLFTIAAGGYAMWGD